MKNVISMLEGGDRRSIGRVHEVVRAVIKEPEKFRAPVDGLVADDEVVRMRCAEAIGRKLLGQLEVERRDNERRDQ